MSFNFRLRRLPCPAIILRNKIDIGKLLKLCEKHPNSIYKQYLSRVFAEPINNEDYDLCTSTNVKRGLAILLRDV